jgi:hypothetical protein
MWTRVSDNIPYGFTGVMGPGTYVIADNQLSRTSLEDGIWKKDSYLATLEMPVGYFSIYTDHSICHYGTHGRVSILPIEEAIDPHLGYTFTSLEEFVVRAEEVNCLFDIKLKNTQIIVEFADDDMDSVS